MIDRPKTQVLHVFFVEQILSRTVTNLVDGCTNTVFNERVEIA